MGDTVNLLELFDVMNFINELSLAPKKYIRDSSSPVESLNNREFRRRYRFSKENAWSLVPLLDDSKSNKRGLPIPASLQTLIVLRFFATGSFQIVCGDLSSVSQSTVSCIIRRAACKLASSLGTHIKFPSQQERLANSMKFYRIAYFPNVSGCIDGTHIPILSPGGPRAEIFRNRKGRMSLNIQVISGPELEILDIIICWPGSAHDSRIFENSAIKIAFEENQIEGLLLGDKAYAQRKYFFTPVQNPVSLPERRYNFAHAKTRNVVKRLFGVWKRKFGCLDKKLAYKISTVTRIISACAVLHNIALQRGEYQDEDEEESNRRHDENETEENPGNMRGSQQARAIKAAFIARHFSRCS